MTNFSNIYPYGGFKQADKTVTIKAQFRLHPLFGVRKFVPQIHDQQGIQ